MYSYYNNKNFFEIAQDIFESRNKFLAFFHKFYDHNEIKFLDIIRLFDQFYFQENQSKKNPEDQKFIIHVQKNLV